MGDPAEQLGQCFLQTFSPDPNLRKQAEKYLSDLSLKPHYAIHLLKLISLATMEEQIRQAAAVNFKNFVKYRWSPSDEEKEEFGDFPEIQVILYTVTDKFISFDSYYISPVFSST